MKSETWRDSETDTETLVWKSCGEMCGEMFDAPWKKRNYKETTLTHHNFFQFFYRYQLYFTAPQAS